ncbi:MAG: efflux RND transporter periplasmic adaptor subunit [Gemmataceae bacterium]|nr:efflux RND transporter periplasmic adaptor subunit [Gemmataceae bacterium]
MSFRTFDLVARRRLRPAALGALAVLVTVAVTWLWAHEGHAPLPTKGAQIDVAKGQVILSREAREALGVQTAEVELRPVEEKVLAYATLVAPWQQHAFVTARLPGRINKLHVQPGQAVAAGQPLAEVQSLELENLQLELLNAANDIQLSAKILEQMEMGGQRGTVSPRNVQEVRTKYREHGNALEIARSKWLSLGLSQESLDGVLRERNPQLIRSLPISSPIQGVVIHADLAVGKVVEPTEHLFEIIDVSKVWVQIGVLEQDLHKVSVGQPVELRLTAYPGEVFRNTVAVKGLYLDPHTHLGIAWAELSNAPGQEPRLLPGMQGQARLIIATSKSPATIPAAALISDGAERYVLVEVTATAQASEYQKQSVVVGRQTPEIVAIRAGKVYPGDRVVTRGSHELASLFVQGVLRLSEEAKKNIGLRVEPVRRHVVEDVLEVDGAVDVPPDRRTFASAQLAGTLQTIRVERGQAVRAGDVLAEVASLELQSLQLDLLRAHLQVGLLEEVFKALRNVDQILARRQIWETESLYNATRNRRESVQRKLETVGLSPAQLEALLTRKKLVESLPIRASIDGVVVHFDKVLGQVIKAEEPVFEIHDLSHTWVQGYLSERDLAHVQIGQRARVRLVADPSFLAEGTVAGSGRVFGAENRTLSLWVQLDKRPDPVLQHNMLARLKLTRRRPEPTLAVPWETVVREGLRAYVFVQKPDGTFDRRPIETGRADDRYVEITQGLQAEEKVAVRGTADLQTAYASLR